MAQRMVKNPAMQETRVHWQPPPVFLPGKSHGQRSLVGYVHVVTKELDTSYQLNNNKVGLHIHGRLLEASNLNKANAIPC